MSHRRTRWAALIIGTAALLRAGDTWNLSYFFDKAEQNFDIADIACPSAGHCLAAGAIEIQDKFNPWAVMTSDAGAHWTPVRIADLPSSLFFLNANTGWMAADKGIWGTTDGGATWKKLHGERGVRRILFLDEKHGFAEAGNQLLETTNGGTTWTENRGVKEQLQRDWGAVELEWLFFADARNGMMIGELAATNNVPAWLEPPRGRNTRTPADVVVIGRTADGGATWNFSSITRHDDLVDVVFRSKQQGLWFVFQPSGAESRSEIARCEWDSNKLTMLLSDNDALVADAVASGARDYVAAMARQGGLLNLPIPSKLLVYSGTGFDDMRRNTVDWRAVARRATFAAAGDDVFLATDTGMILKLARLP